VSFVFGILRYCRDRYKDNEAPNLYILNILWRRSNVKTSLPIDTVLKNSSTSWQTYIVLLLRKMAVYFQADIHTVVCPLRVMKDLIFTSSVIPPLW